LPHSRNAPKESRPSLRCAGSRTSWWRKRTRSRNLLTNRHCVLASRERRESYSSVTAEPGAASRSYADHGDRRRFGDGGDGGNCPVCASDRRRGRTIVEPTKTALNISVTKRIGAISPGSLINSSRKRIRVIGRRSFDESNSEQSLRVRTALQVVRRVLSDRRAQRDSQFG
jgi:hypothetical protein